MLVVGARHREAPDYRLGPLGEPEDAMAPEARIEVWFPDPDTQL